MRHITKAIALTLALATAVPFLSSRAADPVPAGGSIMGGNGPIDNELDQPTRDAIKKGLEWLHKNLANDNSINGAGGQSAGIVGLAGLAFMASGSMPGDGPYGKDVDRVLDYVLKNCQPTGLVAGPNDGSPMYGHGFATLFLAEVYGMTQREDVGEKLHKAIKLIVSTQDDELNGKAGGWRYQPIKSDADISVTICQVMALRAARNAGIKIPVDPTINKAIQYVKAAQDPDGGFMYTLGSQGSAFPRSAAGTACLYYMRTGNGFEKELDSAIKYLKNHLPNGRNDGEGHFYYGNYYATQAMFMAGGDAWKAYWPAIKKALLDRQVKGDGSWADGEGGGPVYSTAMALIMLQVPNRLLPILQK